MAKTKRNTIKSQLEELDRETLQDLSAQRPVAPVATTNYTGVQDVLGASPAYQAGYAAERARLDAALAGSPLFAGQQGGNRVQGMVPDQYAGQVGGDVTRRIMEQGVNPNVAQSPAGSIPPEAEAPVEPVQAAAAPVPGVGSAVREKILRQGVVPDEYAGKVGGDIDRQIMQQGLYPRMQPPASQGSAAEGGKKKGAWDSVRDDILAPYENRVREYEQEQRQLQQLDEEMQRREDARKRIVALGDAFASFANLIGAAHNGGNDKMSFASPLVAESVEGARKLRVGRMEQIRRNLDEQRQALLELQLKNDPNYLPNKQAQDRINATLSGQQLQYDKLANTAANQAATQALNREKFERQLSNDEWSHEFKERQQGAKEKNDAAKVAQGWSRINLANKKYADQQAGRTTSGSGGKGRWSKGANFNAFKTEVANRAGYSTWEEFANSVPATDRDMRTFVDNVNGAASSTTKQEGILSNYAEQYAPDFFGKYYIDETKQTSPTSSNGKKANPMGPAPKKKKANPMN